MAQSTVDSLFAQFIANNPWSKVETRKGQGDQIITVIRHLWGDENVITWCNADEQKGLADAINHLLFPPRLSAIWHMDTKALEVVWTAKKLPPQWQELKERFFTFDFDGHKHECRFDKSSDRLLALAKHTLAAQDTATFGRNMQSFWFYRNFSQSNLAILGLVEPLSFWIQDVDYDEEKTIDLIEHLNFYLTYYDAVSPYIVIHTPPKIKALEGVRYVRGAFPTEIKGRLLDHNLLSFWIAGRANNPMTAFLLYYRIIEYASGTYIDLDVRSKIRRALLAPNAGSEVEQCINEIIEAMPTVAKDDPGRIRKVIEGAVRAKDIWKDISKNIAFFSEETKFGGGFSVKPIVARNEKEEDFLKGGLGQLADALRLIRNAIAHGKDQETKGVVTPSQHNMQLLRPWLSLATTAASDVVLYKDV